MIQLPLVGQFGSHWQKSGPGSVIDLPKREFIAVPDLVLPFELNGLPAIFNEITYLRCKFFEHESP